MSAVGASVLALLVGLLMTSVAQAHVAGASSAAANGGVTLDALLVAGVPMLIAAVLYGLGTFRLAGGAVRTARSTYSRVLRATSFYAGLAVLALALFSSLDRWAAELFSAHMIQHELLMLAAAPLLVLGRPLPVFLWGFNGRARAAVAHFFKRNALQESWVVIHGAGCAWLLHALALWIWHVPKFFNAAVVDRFTHDLQHLTFLATALLFWSSLFEARRATKQGAAILYLFTTTIHTGILGALIALASRPWYADFLQPSSGWQLSALEDQQLGGLIMWVPGSVVYVGTALVLFARWVQDSERHTGFASQSGSTGAVIRNDSDTPTSFNRARQEAGSSP